MLLRFDEAIQESPHTLARYIVHGSISVQGKIAGNCGEGGNSTGGIQVVSGPLPTPKNKLAGSGGRPNQKHTCKVVAHQAKVFKAREEPKAHWNHTSGERGQNTGEIHVVSYKVKRYTYLPVRYPEASAFADSACPTRGTRGCSLRRRG